MQECSSVLALIALGVTVLGVVWCGFFLMRALIPRVQRGVRAAPNAEHEEALAIAIALAQIVEAKYRAVRLGMFGWVVAATALLCWTALSPP